MLSLTKCVVVVDADVDVHDYEQVLFYAGANVDPKRDVIISEGPLDHLDHAPERQFFGGKLGIDATAKWPEEGARPWPDEIEMSPEIKELVGRETIGVTGCSFGAYHALTMALRHPDVSRRCITMGGAFDVTRFLDGYFDEDAYLLCPPHFLPGLSDAVVPRPMPPQQVGARHRRARHLPRATPSRPRRCCAPRASRTACTSGATARTTTGRTGDQDGERAYVAVRLTG